MPHQGSMPGSHISLKPCPIRNSRPATTALVLRGGYHVTSKHCQLPKGAHLQLSMSHNHHFKNINKVYWLWEKQRRKPVAQTCHHLHFLCAKRHFALYCNYNKTKRPFIFVWVFFLTFISHPKRTMFII